jgi:hypothetical protein
MSTLFQNDTKTLPKQDGQIVRVSMKQNEIAGRTDHIPTPSKAGDMAISHVPNAGSKT